MDYLDIKEAINYLKQGYILVSLENKSKVLFAFKNDKYLVKTNNANMALSFNDFINLYSSLKFIVYEEDDFEVSKEKDEEYYSFKHK